MNYDHRAHCALITGKKGSGKTTHWLHRLCKHRAKWKFIYDPDREVSRKLKLPVCIDTPSLNKAVLQGGFICFDPPERNFPGDRRRDGFAFFTLYVFNVSRVLKGVKLIGTDEVQSVQRTGENGLPTGLKAIADRGRREEIDCEFAAQRLNEINDDVRAQLTVVITHKHDDPLALAWLEERGFDPEAVAALPAPGGWIMRTDDGAFSTNTRRKVHQDPDTETRLVADYGNKIDPPRTADRRGPAKIRVSQGDRRPSQHRAKDGRFSSSKPAAEAPGQLPL